jgi:hypothetical protein
MELSVKLFCTIRGMGMMVIRGMENNKLDKDWVNLILQAKKMGLTPEEVRIFLSSAGKLQKSKNVTIS